MMLLACLLPLLVSVAAWPTYPGTLEQTLEQRSGSELIQLFRHLGDENVAAAIAKEIETLNIDPTIPFSRMHPETAWIAVQKIVSIMVPTVVPESCGETFALKAFLGGYLAAAGLKQFFFFFFQKFFERILGNEKLRM